MVALASLALSVASAVAWFKLLRPCSMDRKACSMLDADAVREAAMEETWFFSVAAET